MRTKSTNQRKSMLNITAVMLVFICLIMMIAIIFSSSSITDIAYAASKVYPSTDNADTVGAVSSSITSDDPIDANDFLAITSTVSGNAVTWKWQSALRNVSVTRSNHQAYKNGGKTDLYITEGLTGQWQIGIDDAENGGRAVTVMNYKLDDFLKKFLTTENVTVTAKVTMTLTRSDTTDKGYCGLSAVSSVMSAESAHSLVDGAEDSYTKISDDVLTGTVSAETTLTSSTTHLAIISGMGFGYIFNWTNGTARSCEYKDVTIDFTVTMPYGEDGSNPVATSQYVSSVSDTFSPYLTSASTSNGWPVHFESIKDVLEENADNISYGNGTMTSFTQTALGTISGKNYYKKTKITYSDTYDWSGSGGFSTNGFTTLAGMSSTDRDNAIKQMGIGNRTLSGIDTNNIDIKNPSSALTWDSGGNVDSFSGIKSVVVGDDTSSAVFFVPFIASSETKSIHVEGVEVGVATLTKTNRAEISLDIYIFTNAKIRTVVNDFNNRNVTDTIEYSGIDTTAPKLGAQGGSGVTATTIAFDEGNPYINLTGQNLNWYRSDKFDNVDYSGVNVDIFEGEEEFAAPYLWFFKVAKSTVSFADIDSTSPVKTYSNYSTFRSSESYPSPFACENIASFNYDFTTGYAKGMSGEYDVLGGATGVGYYRFTFYTVDLCGNMSEQVSSYYIKVDYEAPTYTLDYTSGDGNTILPADNGKWSTDKVTLAMTFKLAYSGNTVIFNVDENSYMFVIDGVGEQNSADGAGYIVSYLNGSVMTDKNSVLSIDNYAMNTAFGDNGKATSANVKIEWVDDTNVKLSFTFDTPQETIAFLGDITLYTGQYASMSAVEDDADMALSYRTSDWGAGVKVYIDRQAPDMAEYVKGGDEAYISELVQYVIPNTRNWYTDNTYKYDMILNFEDSILTTDYSKGLTVYTGMKNITNASELSALQALDIANNYQNIVLDGTDAYKTYFDRLQAFTTLENGENYITYDFIQELSSGMRIYYVWVVDQAGNISGIKSYYTLVDGTKYTIKSSILANTNIGNTASIMHTDAEDAETTSFRRGDEVKVLLSLTESEDGDIAYVPYKLSLIGGSGDSAVTTLLLDNYTTQQKWNLANENYRGLVNFSGYEEVSYIHDSKDSLGALDSVTTIQFAHRQIIKPIYTNVELQYSAQPISLPIVLDNEKARDSIKMVYVDDSNNPLYVDANGNPTINPSEAVGGEDNPSAFIPVVVGTYNVRVFIDKYDDSFVIDTFSMDNDGNQIYQTMQISIIKGNIVVSAVPTQSVYGEEIVLKYTLAGITQDRLADENIIISLALDIQDYSPIGAYNIGEYAIVGNISTLENCNYNVVFESNAHTINPKDITINTWSASKIYGDNDTSFLFAIKQDASYSTTLAMLQEYGYNCVGEESVGADTYSLFEGGNRISRVSGENVNSYNFIVNTQLFDINDNYNIVVDNKAQFTITQRTVTLDASGQSTILPYGATFDASQVSPTYTLELLDGKLKDEIDALVAGNLSVAQDGVEISTPSGYSQAFSHAVQLNTLGNANIRLVLYSGSDYIVYFAMQDSLIIRALGGANFNFVYGTQESDVNARLVFSLDNFIVESSSETPIDYDTITWVLHVNGGGIYNVGTYGVGGSEIVISKDGTPLDDVSVVLEDFTINIIPAQIVVAPTATKLDKEYGEVESAFGIGFDISTVNGVPLVMGESYANVSFEEIRAQIIGEFARARYATNGTLVALGARYDSATDAQGNVLALNNGILESTTDYYGYAVSREFATLNNNFEVIVDINRDARFIINQKQITLDTSNFIGVSRSYNGTTEVYYTSGGAYDFSGVLVRLQDNLALGFSANYSTVGSATAETAVSITFENITLTGESAHNYVLVAIENGGGIYSDAQLKLDGTSVSNATFGEGAISVIISRLDNKALGDDSNLIKITLAKISIYKTDITVSKQYDASKSLSIDNIKIANTSGAQVLYQIATQGGLQLVTTNGVPQFSGVNVGSNYSFSSLSIFFPMANAGSIINQTNIETGNDITISLDENGILVTVVNIGASITKRVINAQSFVSIQAIDRDYNSTDAVDTEYVLTATALAGSDTARSLGLTLNGVADGVNVGTHNVTLSSTSALTNGNYELDIDSINSAYRLSVNINKAKLVPNVVFEDRPYDTTSVVNYNAGSGTLLLTTLNYSANLINELAQLQVSTTITYVLSANGVADGNVKGDASNGYAHNVLVSGLKISGDEAILANYEIYGQRYVDGTYVALGEIVSGEEIAPYEIIDAVNITRVYLPIINNNVTVADKIYNGSSIADITIKLQNGVVPSVDAPYIQIIAEGHFERAAAGNNLQVELDSLYVDVMGGGNEAIINNYEIDNELDVRLTGNILRIPMAINIDEPVTQSNFPVANISIGAQYYNGNAKVDSKYFTKSIVGVLADDEGVYDVIMGDGAYYYDSDVEVERDASGNVVYYKDKECTLENKLELIDGVYYDSLGQEVTQKYAKVLDKAATIYNLKLLSNRGSYVNYILTYPSQDNSGNYVAYLDAEGVMHYYEKSDSAVAYFYALDTVSQYVEDISGVNADDVVGSFVEKGKTVYLIKDSANVASAQSLGRILTYFNTVGRINQKTVSINEGGIEAINPLHFNKVYDGTTKFYGVKDVDFREKGNSIIGVISLTEDVEIADIYAQFSMADAGECAVIFQASGIKGEHAYRYTISSTTNVQTKIDAKILPRAINTFLADGTMLYGARIDRIDGDVTYGFGSVDNHIKVDLIDGELFVNYKEYLVLIGFLDSVDDAIDTQDEAYLTKLLEKKYTYDSLTNSYGLAEDGTHIKLASKVDAPEVFAQFGNTIGNASAGSIATLYTTRGGKADNFSFLATHADGSDTSRLEVLKRDLLVYVDGSNFRVTYGEGSFPSADEYLEYSGCEIAGETPKAVFAQGTSPKTRIALYDPLTGELSAINKYAKINADEAMQGKFYVYEVYIPAGVDYSSLNYNVIIADITKKVDGDVVTPMYSCGDQVMGNASLLTISLPTIRQNDITETSADTVDGVHNFVYAVDDNGAGINRLYNVINGYHDNDVITFENNRVAINAGEYGGKIKVTRYVKVDERDANGYAITWLSENEIKINIAKANLNATAGAHKVDYNGSTFSYNVSSSSDYFYVSGANVSQSNISVSVAIDKNGERVEYTDPIVDAGVYYVTVKISGLDNFKDWSKTTTLTVQRAKAYVTMDKSGFTVSQDIQGGIVVEKLSAIFNENGNYVLPFTVRMGDETLTSDIALTVSDLEFMLSNSTLPIEKAGRYTYKVVMKDGDKKASNYNIIGGSGILELLADALETEGGNIAVDSGVLADELRVRDIVVNPQASDEAYLNAIKQFMPSISKEAGLNGVAQVAAVYRIGLYRNGQEIDASGININVCVAIPDGMDKNLSGIAVYMIGQDGVMNKLDYQLGDGVIQYSTDYLGTLVFVDINPEPIEPWILYAGIGGAALLGLIVVGFVLAFIARKARLKKLD